MKKIFLVFFLLVSNFCFCQKVTAFDNVTETNYLIDLPDTLFVVWGQKIITEDYFYLDFEENWWIGTEIFLLDKPIAKSIYSQYWEDYQTRIDLTYSTEIFFSEDFTNNFQLEDSMTFFHCWEINKISKLKSIKILKFKKVVFIPYNIEGDKITASHYFDIKFGIERLLKILMNNQKKE